MTFFGLGFMRLVYCRSSLRPEWEERPYIVSTCNLTWTVSSFALTGEIPSCTCLPREVGAWYEPKIIKFLGLSARFLKYSTDAPPTSIPDVAMIMHGPPSNTCLRSAGEPTCLKIGERKGLLSWNI